MRTYLETLGCQMNKLDSELVVGMLRESEHTFVDDPKQAELVIYNTCSVREHAEDKVLSRLGWHDKRQADGAAAVVGVIGCMAQRMGGELTQRFASVDFVCGPGQIHRLPDLIDAALDGRKPVALDPARSEPRDAAAEAGVNRLDVSRRANALADEPALATLCDAQAYVRVARGCNQFCSYCIVPFVRGPERSRPPQAITEEVRKLLDAGITDVTLLGQTVNSYRHAEPNGPTTRFADLLAHLSCLPGLRRLRFVTSHPAGFTRDVLEAIRGLPNVCEYIHCPAQHGSDSQLQAMNRGYSRAEYDDFVAMAREVVPEVVLASDFIVGFPGEREADHQQSTELIRQAGFKNSFIFKYSPRPGTMAERTYADDIPDDVKKRRNAELLAVQNAASLAHHEGYVGREMEIIVTGPSARHDKQATPPTPQRMQLMGRSRGDHIVIVDGPERLIGQYVDVTVTGANDRSLFGDLRRQP
ncbi:MAG: tRNA (N6-isopentenyl adenosine(37)-C2)-methylthiotransferase MiaB [Planctomycetes bacterium]|jgi:tRNA-2-methylthio-N6-dimethylallyladenosine synthase|nr:tRNA (N6-isopentenyl adenosine(37)-C2)-methylthiotransferase MiaB [Planctomycetota bacterium]